MSRLVEILPKSSLNKTLSYYLLLIMIRVLVIVIHVHVVIGNRRFLDDRHGIKTSKLYKSLIARSGLGLLEGKRAKQNKGLGLVILVLDCCIIKK